MNHAKPTKNALNTADRIARQTLGLETLEERKMDSLDFHDLGVLSIKQALLEAYAAGAEAGMKKTTNQIVRADGRTVRVSVPRDED